MAEKMRQTTLLNYPTKNDTIDKLYYRLNLLHSLKEKFNNDEIKGILINAYNNTHKQDVKSLNKRVREWKDHAYQNAIIKIIDSIQKESKERQKDPIKKKRSTEQYYRPDSELLISNIESILDKKGLTPNRTDIKNWLHAAGFSEVKKTEDFAIQYIEERLKPDVVSIGIGGPLGDLEGDIFRDIRTETKKIWEHRLKFAQDTWWDMREHKEKELGRELTEKELKEKIGTYPERIEDIKESEIFEVPKTEKEFNEQLKGEIALQDINIAELF